MSTIKKIVFSLFLIIQFLAAKSQCDFSGTVSVSTSGYFTGAGYTQEYILVNDGSDAIVTINSTGTFTPIVSGNYRIYAVNYQGARPAVLTVGEPWSGVVTYATSNCLEYTAPYMNRAISICEQICSGSNLVVSTTGQTSGGGYEQLYVVVNSAGQIVASNSTGIFPGLAVGTYNVYAVNTNDAVVKAEITNLGSWSDIPAFSNAYCYQILGPRIFTVVAGPEATFSLIPDCAGANNSFSVQVNITSLGGATSVNIKDLIPTTHQSDVGTGSYLISGYPSGSTQTVIVEDALNNTCTVSQSGLTFTCLDLPTCTGLGGVQNMLTEGFEDGSMPAGWSQVQVSGTINWTYRTGATSGTVTTAHTGTKNACFQDNSFSNYTTKLITPAINFTAGMTNATLTFWHAQEAWSSDIDKLKVYYKTSAGGSWILLQSYETSVTNWTQQTIALPNINSTYYLAFEGITHYARGLVIDDILVTAETPSAGVNIALKQDLGSTNAFPQCVYGGWTYYAIDNTSPYLFAIDWSPDGTLSPANENSRDASSVILTLESDFKVVESPTCATYSSKRYWNVSFSSALVFDENVKVKYYYDVAENSEIVNAKDNFVTTQGAVDEGESWFKTTSGGFNPNSNITACNVVNSMNLTTESSGLENAINYVTFANIHSFSGGGFTSGASKTVLPISLLDFQCKLNNLQVDIFWETATEINNDFFTVERAADGINFSPILTKKGAGNSNEVLMYSDIDQNPLPNISYYRLKQTDFDGKYSYSNVVSIINKNLENSFDFVIYPNPAEYELFISINSERNELRTCKIFDTYGKLVWIENIQTGTGKNKFAIDLDKLSQGFYSIQISSSLGVITKSFIKSK